MECLCQVQAHLAECKKGKNSGKWFYGCGRYGTGAETCKFFKWAETPVSSPQPVRSPRAPSKDPQLKRRNAMYRSRSPSIEEMPPTQPLDELPRKRRTITTRQSILLDQMIDENEQQFAQLTSEEYVYQKMLAEATKDLYDAEPNTYDFVTKQMVEKLIRESYIEIHHKKMNVEAKIFLLREQKKKTVE